MKKGSFLKRFFKRLSRISLLCAVSLRAFAQQGVLSTYDPNGTASSGDMIGYAASLTSELMVVGGYLLIGAGYLVAIFISIHEVVRLKRGDSDFGKLAMMIFIAVTVVILVTWFGNLMIQDAGNLNNVSGG